MSNFIEKNMFRIVFALLIALAFFLRFYQLGQNPPSLDWDEVSLGYNAYTILKTGADEYGTSFPLSIRSFDDYKPPVYAYLTVPTVALFGLNELSVRLPSAVIGLLTVIVTVLFVRLLFDSLQLNANGSSNFVLRVLHQAIERKWAVDAIGLLSGFFLAISPWHLQFSRAAFEGNVGLFFFVLGTYLFLCSLKNKWLFMLSAFSFLLGMYSYHSFRLITPILIGILFLLFSKPLIQQKRYLGMFVLILLIGVLPIVQTFFTSAGSGARLSMVTVFTPEELQKSSLSRMEYDRTQNDFIGTLFHNRRVVYTLAVVKGYLDHFNPDFLFLHGDGGRQHHAVDMGMVYLWELPFILVGVLGSILLLNRKIVLLLLLLFIAPSASSITTGTPHPVRAIAMIPPLHIFTAFGVLITLSALLSVRKRLVGYAVIIMMIFALFLNMFYYFHQYYVHTPIEYGDFWQYGHKEAVLAAAELEDAYEKIIFTYRYDQPYAYYLFHRQIDPQWYQKNWDYSGTGEVERMRRVIGKYEFRNISFEKDRESPRTLLIGTPSEIPENANNLLKTIYFPDGSVAFRIVGT